MTEDEEFAALEQRLNMKEQEYEQINHPNGVTTWKTKPKEQPEALRLADALDFGDSISVKANADNAAAELRRLHALNQELLEALNTCVCAMQDYQAGIGITEMFDAGERLGRAAIAKAQGASNE